MILDFKFTCLLQASKMKTAQKISVYITLAYLALSVRALEAESETSSGLVALKPVLKDHSIQYTDPLNVRSKYASQAQFDPRGMHHVYAITHFFLDLIQREQVRQVPCSP